MKTCIVCCVLFLFLSFEGHAAESTHVNTAPRFIDVPVSNDHLSKADKSTIERERRADPSIEWVIPVKIDPRALDYDHFDAFLYDRHVVIRKSADQGTESQFGEVWRGEVWLPGDPPGWGDHEGLRAVQIIRSEGGRIYGSIRIGELFYSLNYLSSGSHVLTKQDLSKLNDSPHDVMYPDKPIKMIPEPEPDAGIDGSPPSSLPPITPPTFPPERIHIIRVAIAFTPSAERGNQEALLLLIQDALVTANQSFLPSDVTLQLQVAAYARPSYTERTMMQMLSDLQRGQSGPLWLAHVARHEQYADVLALVVSGNSTDVCGLAPQVGSTRETALLVVRRDCLGSHALTHEIGHLLGANHNPEDIDIASPYPYGHGYRRATQPGNPGFSTMMSVTNCPTGCPRQNRWSNPHRTRPNGEPMGTVGVHHNARVLNQTKAIVANFYPDPPRPQGGGSASAVRLYTPGGSQVLTDP